MNLAPNTPVIVGVAQLTPVDRTAPTSSLQLLTRAARDALADTGAADVLRSAIGSVGTTDCLTSELPDMALALADELGIAPKRTVGTRTSGTSPIDLLADACARISSGELSAALIGGAEAVKAYREDRRIPEPPQPEDATPTAVLGDDRQAIHEAELAAELMQPMHFYPMFENAIRHAEGSTVADHRAKVASLCARFGEVAATNPHAWVADPPNAEAIEEVSEGNRMIAFPYPKLMTANIYVDQAAAVVVCSSATAEAAGIPRDRWVFVHESASANDHWFVGERDRLDRSPAIRAIGDALLSAPPEFVDLYSCFPCAVQISAAELGIDLAAEAAPTVTGGLTFAGGPGSNYVMHSLAAMTAKLRENPDSTGLCTAVGWFMTKHAAALLSTRVPQSQYRYRNLQSQVDGLPRRTIATGAVGPAVVETYTVTYDRAGTPSTGYLACLLPDGQRAFARTHDRETVARLLAEDPIGTSVELDGDAGFSLS